MASTQNPATLAACGAPVTDLAGASINPDNSHSIRALQVTRLTGFCANTEAMAAIVDPLIFGEVLTRQIWQPRIGRDLADEDARQIMRHITGLFGVLAEWARAEKMAAAAGASAKEGEACHEH